MNYTKIKKDFKKNGYIIVDIESIKKKISQVNFGINNCKYNIIYTLFTVHLAIISLLTQSVKQLCLCNIC